MVEDLLRRAVYLADKLFRQRRDLRTMIWLTISADRRFSQFETSCSAPDEIDDGAALAALRAELTADFARDGVVAYGVAYSGKVTYIVSGSGPLAQPASAKLRAIVIEAHDGASDAVAICDIIGGSRPRLGAPQQGVRASGRFGDLLPRDQEAA